MNSEYKLIYFPLKALAEPIRFILCYGGMKFEDVRIEKNKWPVVKEDMPFGQLPVLEVDGKMAHQSVAIARYLAKQTDLVGKNDWENLEIDAMVDTITDLRSKISNYNKEKNEAQKASLKEALDDEILPYYLSRLNSGAAGSGFLVLQKLTWADLYFVSLLDYCNSVMKSDIIKDYPNLIAVRINVYAIPSVCEWIEKRPESEY